MRLAIVLLTAILLACGSGNNEKTGAESAPEETANGSEDVLGSIPRDSFETLFQQCDFVDIIFYNDPVSMNQSDRASIQKSLLFITPQPAELKDDCKPLGRISYMAGGEIRAEADFYATEGCYYLVFMEDNQPVYANVLSQSGRDFFAGILDQVEKAREQQ